MPLLPVIVTALGGFLLFKLKFFPITRPLRTARLCLSAATEEGDPRSLLLALAGTLGVGNILGVAISIAVGGAGSVFWLLVSGLFASVIKYAEATVSVDALASGESQGGMMYVIERRLGCGSVLGKIYAAICLLLAFFMGGALQSSAAVSSLTLVTGLPPLILTLLFVTAALVFILANREKIKSLTAALVPLAAVCYVFLTLFVIFTHISELPRVISDIFREAFTLRSAGGGIAGFLLSSPIARGYSTGILSNEAGAGTSSMAHTSGGAKKPTSAGLSAMLEVFADTTVLCTLTALAILLPNSDLTAVSGGELVLSTFSSVFPLSDWLLALSVMCFALATVACWYFYGLVSWHYVLGGGEKLFLPLYAAAVALGALLDSAVSAALSDVLLLILTLLTAPVIIKSSDRIRSLSEQDGVI